MKIMLAAIVLFFLAAAYFEILSWGESGILILFAFTGAYIFHIKVLRDEGES